MMRRIRLIHWNPKEAKEKAAVLETAGFRVIADPLTSSFLKELRNETPDAVVIDLTRLPSAGRDVGVGICSDKNLQRVPVVFVDGDPKKVDRIREILPHAVFTSWAKATKAIKKAIRNPTLIKNPPRNIMAAYAGVPLFKKLGMESGSTVVLVDAPRGWEDQLVDRPKGIRLLRNTRIRRSLTIWFVISRNVLNQKVKSIARCADQGPVWIAWPKKSSRVKSDLSQVMVRRIAESAGLVDYKICSMDDTWSGLLFTWKERNKK